MGETSGRRNVQGRSPVHALAWLASGRRRPGSRLAALVLVFGSLAALLMGASGATERTASESVAASAVSGRSLVPTRSAVSAAATRTSLNAFGRLPLSFELNRGQASPRVKFLAHGSGYTLFLTPSEAVLALQKSAARSAHAAAMAGRASLRTPPRSLGPRAVLRMRFVGANLHPVVLGQARLPGKVNYLLGNNPRRRQVGIPTFARVVYRNAYPGVDLVYYGRQGRLEYDYLVRPGADPSRLKLRFGGAEKLRLTAGGDLLLRVRGGTLRLQKPSIYQELPGARRPIAGGYVLNATGEVGFRLGAYDASRPLVIDPGLLYSTYLGGSNGDSGFGIAVDSAGDAYVYGDTSSTDFPTTAGAFQTGGNDLFVSKLNPQGSGLVYSTYLGGSNSDYPGNEPIAVDSAGDAYVTGSTLSTDFPTTAGALQTTFGGGYSDAFVSELNPQGSGLVYSTYLGGSNSDSGSGIAVDSAGSAYVTGGTSSADFPTTAGAFQTTPPGSYSDAFVSKLNPQGSGLLYSTYLGGSSNGESGIGIAVDSAGSAYVTGYTGSTDFPTTAGAFQTTSSGSYDVFVSKLNPQGSGLVYSTYLGGSSSGNVDEGFGIAVDSVGDAYVTGVTFSGSFPTTAGAFQTTAPGGYSDAFVSKLNPQGSGLVYSTYLGGSSYDQGYGIGVDFAADAYVTGITESTNFPTTAGAFQTTYGSGYNDVFVSKLNTLGSGLLYSTFLHGSYSIVFPRPNDYGFGIAVDAAGDAYVTGATYSADFPTTAGAFQTTNGGSADAFVTKISTAAATPTAATLTLSPTAGVGTVGGTATFTATVTDATNNPVANITVRFTVSGSVNTSGSCVTGANGQCSFSYTGPNLPGADAIMAYADTNNNGIHDPGEPTGEATMAWLLPTATVGQATGGGQIANASGEAKIAFGFTAKSDSHGARGECSVVDTSPVNNIQIKCTDVTTLVETGNKATFFGDATMNGAATTYRIDVQDNAEPGAGADTFSIQTASGYTASGTLVHGNIQIH
jgi:hypothetical protein